MNPRISLGHVRCLTVLVMTLASFMSAWCEHKLPGHACRYHHRSFQALKCQMRRCVIKDLATGVSERSRQIRRFLHRRDLLPAEYQVTVTATDSIPKSRMGLKLRRSATGINLTLQVGTVAQSVVVTRKLRRCNSRAQHQRHCSGTTVRELPLNGRSWTDLAALQPASTPCKRSQAFSSGADRGIAVSGSN